jgi:hypothetical protein
MSLKDAHIVISEELKRTEKDMYASETRTQELRRRITYLSGIIVTLRDEVCQNCKGHGKMWHSYAQDDTKLEPCSQCKGSGLPNRA